MLTKSPGNGFREALLDAVKDNPVAKLRILARLAEWGGQTIYLPTVSAAEGRVFAARKMLSSGMDRASVADALRKRFGCSLRTAQRDVVNVEILSQQSVVIAGSNDAVVQPNPKHRKEPS